MYHDYTLPAGPEALPHHSFWCKLYGTYLRMIMIPSTTDYGAFCSDWWPNGNPPASLLAIAPTPSFNITISLHHLTLSLFETRTPAAVPFSSPPLSTSLGSSSMGPFIRASVHHIRLHTERAAPERVRASLLSPRSSLSAGLAPLSAEAVDRVLWNLSVGAVHIVDPTPNVRSTLLTISPLNTNNSFSRRRRSTRQGGASSSRMKPINTNHITITSNDNSDGVSIDIGAIDTHINHDMIDTMASWLVIWFKRKRVRFISSPLSPSFSPYNNNNIIFSNVTVMQIRDIVLSSLQRIDLTCAGAMIVISGANTAKSREPATVPWYTTSMGDNNNDSKRSTSSSTIDDDDMRMPLLPVVTSSMAMRMGGITYRRGGLFLPELTDPTITSESSTDASVGACQAQLRTSLEFVAYVFPLSTLMSPSSTSASDLHVLQRFPIIDETDANFRLFAHW
jgi:hypothetical protein